MWSLSNSAASSQIPSSSFTFLLMWETSTLSAAAMPTTAESASAVAAKGSTQRPL